MTDYSRTHLRRKFRTTIEVAEEGVYHKSVTAIDIEKWRAEQIQAVIEKNRYRHMVGCLNVTTEEIK